MTPDEAAKRLDNRAGYELIAYQEVGLPVYAILASALVMEKQERSCIEEFALRAISAGLHTVEQVRGILGLPSRVVDAALADLVRQEALRTSPEGTIALTEQGRRIAKDAQLVCPAVQTIWFAFDGLLRKPKWYGGAPFLEPREAKDRGMPLLKPIPARGPELNEIIPTDVSEVVRLAAGATRGERQVLRVKAIEKRPRRFLPAVAIVYRAVNGSQLQIGFAIDGRLSQEHELAFAAGGGMERQAIFDHLHEPPDFGHIGDILSGRAVELVRSADAERKRRSSVLPPARSAVAKARVAVITSSNQSAREQATAEERRARQQLALVETASQSAPVRALSAYEHRGVLEESLETASERLMLISPSIRRAVVDPEFIRLLRRTCGRGVRIAIGYGARVKEAGERAQDAEARQELERLGRELPLLTVRALRDTNAKVLVKDSEFFVITSFNWLSFRGDPTRPFREEWGTMVRDRDLVDQIYQELVARFDAP